MNNDNLALRQNIKNFKQQLTEEFKQKRHINSITRKLVAFTDKILIRLFLKHELDHGNYLCLLAIGSYGRRELLLNSDIDLLLLHEENIPEIKLQQVQYFIQDCWDIGFEISHQITTVSACSELASQDLSVISSILDMHLLCGRSALMDEMVYQTQPLHMWASHDYFFAKQQEQIQRHEKYDETAYNLEPNVKYGPGGLRDLQIILGIGKRHFGIKKLADGINCGFITAKEYEELIHCQYFLWSVRFALHLLTLKKEERLLFDHQVKLAALFGYQDNDHSLAIEQFMKTYFNTIKRVRELNEMLLQWFAEAIIYQQKQKLIPLDDDFQLSNHYIEVRHALVFQQNPYALLQLFLWIARLPTIEGIRASTIRLIRETIYLINENFRDAQLAQQIFMAILKTENNPYEALQRMSRHGVLGHYLTCFGAVTGQMQYDLFHVYTVEQHTLFVIRNITRFLDINYAKQFSLCFQLMPTLPKREILYLAALFHDIAKGRGGDHSELGAIEVEEFARRHRMDIADQNLLVWLVQNHLIMSQTAQRQDIYDPQTIHQFCALLPQPSYLDYLYLLTVADICGTNPSLWNAWKDSLLKELYFATQRAFLQKQLFLDEKELIHQRRQEALKMLNSEGFVTEKVQDLWQHFKGKYFLHESPSNIAKHTQAILTATQLPLILIMPHHTQGGTEIFIYMPHCDDRVTITTTVLSNHHVTIQEASINTCKNNYDLDTYIVLNEHNQAFFDEKKTCVIHQALLNHLTNSAHPPTLTQRRLSRTQAHFNFKPQINFSHDNHSQYTRLFLITNDRPGLLATISQIFLSENIHLHTAKIATAGERVEDMFYINNQEGKMLEKKEELRLRDKLLLQLTY